MQISSVFSLAIPEIKVIRFSRFADHRGYFTETFRESDVKKHPNLNCMKEMTFTQMNESYSKRGAIRGLHFQWNPYMGKLVRTISGHMVDLVLDIRRGSPTFGKIIAHDMRAESTAEYQEWIWAPPGFAHGNFFLENTVIEYFCTGEYSQGCEAAISPLSADLDWSLCETALQQQFFNLLRQNPIISNKDKKGLSLSQWTEDDSSQNFIFPM